MKPQEYEYSSHVAYTRALEGYCETQAGRIDSLLETIRDLGTIDNPLIVEMTQQAVEAEKAILEQAAQIEILHSSLVRLVQAVEYTPLGSPAILAVAEAKKVLTISPAQALQDYTDKVLEKAATVCAATIREMAKEIK